ncbi:MAG: anti-sigma factor, partial [Candidatus Rokubacteria bacterium]|nr:anti-sigma factor [Candidatus Rokubacteria bacterium]
ERRNLRRAWRRWSAATAAAMVVGGLLAGGWVAARYEARLGQAVRELSALRERVVAEQAIVVLLRDPATQVVALRGLGPSPAARGRVIWHETAGGRLVVANLSPAPAGKIYEVWTIRGGAPGPAGVFQVDARGEAVHRIAPAGGPVDVFAVTLEPAGGGPAPTGPRVLASR